MPQELAVQLHRDAAEFLLNFRRDLVCLTSGDLSRVRSAREIVQEITQQSEDRSPHCPADQDAANFARLATEPDSRDSVQSVSRDVVPLQRDRVQRSLAQRQKQALRFKRQGLIPEVLALLGMIVVVVRHDVLSGLSEALATVRVAIRSVGV